jgi:hypothetical protein
MKNINIQVAEELRQEELKTEELIKKMNHPYFGLTDSRGGLERYPITGIKVSRNWIQEYTELGGSVDSCGNWGVSPYWENATDIFSPEIIYLCEKCFGRVDFPDFQTASDIIDVGLEPSTNIEFHRAERGIKRKNTLEKLGISSNKSVLSLGWMTKENFIKLLVKKVGLSKLDIRFDFDYSDEVGVIILQDEFFEVCYFDGTKYVPSISSPKIKRHFETAIKKYCKRLNIVGFLGEYTVSGSVLSDRDYIHKSKKAARIHIKRSYGNNRNFRLASTSAGCLQYAAGLIFRDRKEISTRKIGKYNVFSLRVDQNTKHCPMKYFIFEHDFSNHTEGNSLKDAIAKYESRNRKSGLVFCLNDVRNDIKGTSGFCLEGTKDFLRNKMKFVYRMIEKYHSWGEIPEQIMDELFSINSRGIFEGYPQP